MATAKELVRLSLLNIGVIEAGESMSADDLADSFLVLNMMLGTWGNKRNRILTSLRESFALVVGQTTYTIGTGGDFDTIRPTQVLQSFIRDSADQDHHVEVLEDRAVYEDITDKDIDGRPFQLYFERSFSSQRGKIFFNRAPQAADTVFLLMWKPFTKFSTVTETVVLPVGYEEAIWSQLAIRLAPQFGKSVSAELAQIAKDSVTAIDDANFEVPEMPSDAPARSLRRGGSYNIYSDTFNGN